MPVVPKVDIHGPRRAGHQHQDVDAKADGDDERADRRRIGNGGGCGPTQIEEGQVEVVDFLHLTERGPEVVGSIRQKPRDDTKSDEPDANKKTRLQRLGELDSDQLAEDREDDGHHHAGPETDHIGKDFLHGCSLIKFHHSTLIIYHSSFS